MKNLLYIGGLLLVLFLIFRYRNNGKQLVSSTVTAGNGVSTTAGAIPNGTQAVAQSNANAGVVIVDYNSDNLVYATGYQNPEGSFLIE